jgi:hypothetical protein
MIGHPESQFPLMYAFSSRLIYALAPGLVFVMIGIVLIIKRIWFLWNARDVWGEVISMEERYPFGPFEMRGVRAIPCYLPKIRFTADNGMTYEFIDHSTSRFLSYQVGSSVPVVYDPKDPRKAYIKHVLILWSRLVGILGIGIVLLFLVFLASTS